jgi:dienelactone hydrolase
VFAFASLLPAATLGAGDLWLGQWSGEAATSSENTLVRLQINSAAAGYGGRLTLPHVGVMGWPAKDVQRRDNQFSLVFPSDSGDQTMVLSLGSSDAENTTLSGTWTDARFEEQATLSLRREPSDCVSPSERPAAVAGPAGRLNAAILLPKGKGPFPGVVFLHGSGPQPKDASRFAAHAFAQLGVASIIFDKRGVGTSEGRWDTASFHDLAEDGMAAAEFLLSLPEVSSVGFWGHSQGGWIAPLAGTQWEETSFVITSAGPCVSPAREAHWVFIRKLRSLGVDEEEQARVRMLIERWHDGVRTDDWSMLEPALDEVRQKPWYEASGLAYFAQEADPDFIQSYRISMDHDPVPPLERLTVPLLAIVAPDDESIDALESEAILRRLMRQGNDIQIKRYEGYDHSLRRLADGNEILRWPEHPEDYLSAQAEFIWNACSKRDDL